MIPVPLKASTFTPLERAHAACNVEIDLAGIGTYFAPRARAIGAVDFQLLPEGAVRGRLGNGRGVHYRGYYLKGVGRTQLAANWMIDGDTRHATGHMFPSSAAREYLVSRYAEAHGLADAIVACEGVLARRLPRGARAHVAIGLPEREPIAAIDLRAQAISIKRSTFARLSNFTWALHQLDNAHRAIAEMTLAIERALAPEVDAAACTPRSMIAALAASIDRGWTMLERSFEAGVSWGYIDNNLSACGRALDLEAPTVFGGPIFGVRQDEPTPAPMRAGDRWVGLDALDYARRAEIFVDDLAARFAFLATSTALQHPLARRFAHELGRELARAFPASHVVRSAKARAARVERHLARALDLGATGRRALRTIVAARDRFVADQTDAVIDGAVADVPIRFAQHAPAVRRAFRRPAWAPAPSAAMIERATIWNDAVESCDRARSIEAYFTALRRGARAIAASRA